MKVYLNSTLDSLSKNKTTDHSFKVNIEKRQWEELMSIPYGDIQKIKNKITEIIQYHNDQEDFDYDGINF